MKLETWKPKAKSKLRTLKDLKNVLAGLLLIVLVIGSFKLGKIINEYIYWQQTKDIYTAALIKRPVDYSELKPFRNWKIPDIGELDAIGAISLVSGQNGTKVILEKNASQIRPIGSLSKLFTAFVVIKNYNLEEKTKISKRAVETEENTGQFREGETFTVKELLYSSLVESSNDAARALAEIMGEEKFVNLMNKTAKEAGLKYTHFIDPIGLDPDFPNQGYNYSTAKDLATFIDYLIKQSKEDPSINKIFEITRTPEHEIHLANGRKHHEAYATDKLLKKFPNIFAGKTGQTPKAKQCLLIVVPSPKNNDYIINVILGSNSRFSTMEKIINWLNKAFVW